MNVKVEYHGRKENAISTTDNTDNNSNYVNGNHGPLDGVITTITIWTTTIDDTRNAFSDCHRHKNTASFIELGRSWVSL